MKYIKYLFIPLLLVSVILTFAACNEATNDTTPSATMTSDLQQTELQNSIPFRPDSNKIVYVDGIYCTYESAVHSSNNIIQAKFEGVEYYKRFCEAKFLVEKQYKGNIKEEYVYVRIQYAISSLLAPNGHIRYADHEITFTKGESYLLLLETGNMNVYSPYRVYLMDPVIVPVDNTSESTMYTQPLLQHSGMTEEMLSDYDLFTEYLETCIKQYDHSIEPDDNPYITSDKVADIVSGSDFVVKIKPVKADEYLCDEFTERYSCQVIEQYKGQIGTEKIVIQFFSGDVKAGKEYIVALDSINADYLFFLSSKNSVFDVESESELVELIPEEELPDGIELGMTYKEISDIMGFEGISIDYSSIFKWDLDNGKELRVHFNFNGNDSIENCVAMWIIVKNY